MARLSIGGIAEVLFETWQACRRAAPSLPRSSPLCKHHAPCAGHPWAWITVRANRLRSQGL